MSREKVKIMKWIFDRVMALIGLLLLWPVLIIVAILIKVKMPGGPAIFKQKRVGLDGELFTMYKFRSMAVNHGGSSVSVAGESRITPLGAKLRRYKLDELPELWNVLIGDMSFVGPRPDVPGYADKLEGEDRLVLKLRPGITGPATLKYRDEEEMIAVFLHQAKEVKSEKVKELYPAVEFSSMSDEEIALWYNDNVIYPDKVKINLEYYRNNSLMGDLKLIMQTVLG